MAAVAREVLLSDEGIEVGCMEVGGRRSNDTLGDAEGDADADAMEETSDRAVVSPDASLSES